jgi:regulator of cell morphogenesis and NO signaling
MVITNETPVGAVVAERLGRAGVFERLGIDYCCHGETPLGEACARHSLDADTCFCAASCLGWLS